MTVLLLTALLVGSSWADLHPGLSGSYGAPGPSLGSFSGENIGNSFSVSSPGLAPVGTFTNRQDGFTGDSSRENSIERFAGRSNEFLHGSLDVARTTSGGYPFGQINSVSGSNSNLYSGASSVLQGPSSGFSSFEHFGSSGFSNEVQGVSLGRTAGGSYNGAIPSNQRQSGGFSSSSFLSLSGSSRENSGGPTGRLVGSSHYRPAFGSAGSPNGFSSNSHGVSSGTQRGTSRRLSGESYNGASFNGQGSLSGNPTGFSTSSQEAFHGAASGTHYGSDSSREQGTSNGQSSGISRAILVSNLRTGQSSDSIIGSSRGGFSQHSLGSLPSGGSAGFLRTTSGEASYRGRAPGNSQSNFQGTSGSGFPNRYVSSGQSVGGFQRSFGAGSGGNGGGSSARYNAARSSGASFNRGPQGARGTAGFSNIVRGQTAPAPGYSAPGLEFSSGSREQSFASPGRLAPAPGLHTSSRAAGGQGFLSSGTASGGTYGSRGGSSRGQGGGSSSTLQIMSSIGGRVNIPGHGNSYQ